MRTIQQLAVVLGAAYLAVGVLGFAWTGVTDWLASDGATMIIFEINPFHNLVHILIGAMWLLGARAQQPGVAAGTFLGIGGAYLAATILGFIGALPILAIDAGLAPDNFLHLVTALVAVGAAVTLGDWSSEETSSEVGSGV
jgi:hypothetical protein